jgi:hypothetical protein
VKSLPLTPRTTALEKHPLLIGLRAARANAVPGLMVQSVMIAVVLAYYFWTPARGWLASLAELKNRAGYLFSFFSGTIAGGVLPEILAVGLLQKCRVRRRNWTDLMFGMLYWGASAMVVDALYRGQAWAFGTEVNFITVSKKVAVDQFVYNPLWAAPVGMAAFEWKNQGYRFAGLFRVVTFAFYKEKTIPALVATWGVWIPLVAMIYSLPSLLQIPLFSLALTFWAMLFAWINRGIIEETFDRGPAAP